MKTLLIAYEGGTHLNYRMAEFDFLLTVDVFKKSLEEQKAVLRDFWKKAGRVLDGTGVQLGPIPRKWFSLRHNYFSVLFIVVFYLLKIPSQRLPFYARINHCLRTWVTACDNLLDDELKELIITDLPGKAKIFKSVHAVLTADRIFFLFLREAVKKGVIDDREMELLLCNTMTAMSESGREEAEEEGGVDYSVKPEAILHDVHMAKTGRLFTSPLSAPLALGDISMNDEPVKRIYAGLTAFGLGCQILDDLSDLGTDLYNRKFNYVASVIMHSVNGNERARLIELVRDPDRIKDDHYLYRSFSQASGLAMQEARNQFDLALDLLCRGGLPLNKTKRQMFIKTLLALFGHPRLLLHLRG